VNRASRSIHLLCCGTAFACAATAACGAPTIYPTGTTIYEPAKTWSGYTVFVLPETGAVLIDMNGNTVREWDQFSGLGGGPVRMLPGGYVVGAIGGLQPHQESIAVAEYDWDNDLVWRFDHNEQVERDGKTFWAARQHHDWQRPDFPAGYYSPSSVPSAEGQPTLILAHANVTNPAVSKYELEDDYLYEVSWDGQKQWEWHANEHVDEFGFSPEARAMIHDTLLDAGSGDWLHINAATFLGPNHWYDAGDERFDPRNIIISSRQASFIAILARDGHIVWRLGPDYRDNEKMKAIGQMVGQHHPHMIPKGLPGAGNILVFDNGGMSGWGFKGPTSPDGRTGIRRHFSRVLEIDPVTLDKVWEYALPAQESYRFFSYYVSSAQRLPNGNTMITEGADGRIFEVTTDGEIVWEYVSPYFGPNARRTNRVYRAYRLPYDWVPQLPRPQERAVVPPDVRQFRIAAQ
jgi:outer membrane protein assembly factor BamB